MREGLVQRAPNAVGVPREQACAQQAHVAQRAIGHQALQVLLAEGDHTGVQRTEKAEPDHRVPPVFNPHRHDGEHELEDPVKAHLQHHSAKDHGALQRGHGVGVRLPAVEGEHGQLDRKGQEQRPEQPDLCVAGKAQRVQRGEVGADRSGLHHAIRQAEEEHEAAQKRVDEEAHGDGPPPFPAPIQQQEEDRHQRQFVEDVEEEGVLRREDPKEEALRKEQQRVHHAGMLQLLGVARTDDEGEHHGRQQHHQQADAIVSEREPKPEGGHPVELDGHHGLPRHGGLPQPQHLAQAYEGGDQRNATGRVGGTHHDQRQGCQEGDQEEGQQHHLTRRIRS